jgi:urocanate hydratase
LFFRHPSLSLEEKVIEGIEKLGSVSHQYIYVSGIVQGTDETLQAVGYERFGFFQIMLTQNKGM